MFMTSKQASKLGAAELGSHLYRRSVLPSSGSGISRVVPCGAVTANMVSLPVDCMRTISSFVTYSRALLLECSVMAAMAPLISLICVSSSRLSSCNQHAVACGYVVHAHLNYVSSSDAALLSCDAYAED